MKHPVLIRVFSVVLCILCFVMTGAGILGLQKAEDDYNNNMAAVEKMMADIEEYKMLVAENEGKESYESSNKALGELKEAHEEVSAEHRTELATYTATKSGIKTAVDALDEADAMMANARAEFEAGKAAFEKQYAEFMQGYNGYYGAVALISELQAKADGLLTAIKSLDERKENLALEASQIEAERNELNNLKALGGDRSEEIEYNLKKLGEKEVTYKSKLEDFQSEYNNNYELYNKTYIGLTTQIGAIKAQIEGVDKEQLEAGKAQLDIIAQQMAAGEKQLASAEYELYHSRALIWHENGKLKEQAVELAEEKEVLLQEEQEIIEKEKLSEEQKKREKRIRSLYLTFAEKPEIEEAIKADKDFISSVEAYIDDFNDSAHEDAKFRGIANVLMIASLPFAIFCVLSSFEVVKKRSIARLSSLVILLISTAALCVFLQLGRGVSYSAAGVIIFAIIQFMVSGKVKIKQA